MPGLIADLLPGKYIMCKNCLHTFAALSSLLLSSPLFYYLDQHAFRSPWVLYPPGCRTFVVTEPGNFRAHAKAEAIFSEAIPLWDMGQNTQPDVEVRALRVGRTEPDRSILTIVSTVPDTDGGIQSSIPVPLVFGEIDEVFYPLGLARESHSYLKIDEGLFEGEKVGYYLDNWVAHENYQEFEDPLVTELMLPSQYSGLRY